jgi:hypothetical protein
MAWHARRPFATSPSSPSSAAASPTPSPSPPSSGLGSFWKKLSLLVALGVSGAALALAMSGLTFDEVCIMAGLREPPPPTAADAVNAPPPLDTPDAFVHPYDLLPWYTRYWFMFKRCIFLVRVRFGRSPLHFCHQVLRASHLIH